MSSFSGSIDLMQCKGARLVSGIDEKHPGRNYVCIPVEWSEIKVTEDTQRHTFRASLRVNLWPTSDAFKQACISRRLRDGESVDGYNPPSHTMEVGYSEDFRDKAMAAAKNRLLNEHPDWDKDEQTNKDLRNAMYNAVRVRLGSFYVNIPKQQTAYTAAAPAVGSGISGYQPAQNDDPFAAAAQGDGGMDDLPF